MKKDNTKEEYVIIIVFIILYGGGVIAHNTNSLLSFSLKITELLLLFSNSLVLFFLYRKNYSLKLVTWAVVAYFITFLLEVLGVATGKIFGNYYYGSTLKIQLLKVPVLIGLNWVVLMLGAIHICQRYFSKKYFPFISPILLVAFDFMMEPVAVRFDYWHWTKGVIPIQNYIAWFMIALIFALWFRSLKLHPESKLLRSFFVIQFFFFLILNLLG